MHLIVDPEDNLWSDPRRTWALCRLWMAADAEGVVALSLQQLAQSWQMSRHTVSAILRELEAGGWMAAERRPGRPATYRLTGRGVRREYGVLDIADKPRTEPPETFERMEVLEVGVAPPDHPVRPKPSRVHAKPSNSDAACLVHHHADQYTARFGQPFFVAWARDTQIYKRLVTTYGAETVARFQVQYLNQPLDSFAAKRGFSVPQFAAEIAGMATQDAIRAQLSDAQQAAFAALMAVEGFVEETALALVVDHPAVVIQDQLRVHRWRQQQGQPTSARRLERAIRERWPVPEAAQPVIYPPFPLPETAFTQSPTDPDLTSTDPPMPRTETPDPLTTLVAQVTVKVLG